MYPNPALRNFKLTRQSAQVGRARKPRREVAYGLSCMLGGHKQRAFPSKWIAFLMGRHHSQRSYSTLFLAFELVIARYVTLHKVGRDAI